MPYKGTVQAQMEQIIGMYTKEVVQASDKVFQSVAKECVEKLKDTSPKRKTGGGDYAKGWSVKTVQKGKLTGIFSRTGSYVVYNRTDWHLTHLLEKGHDVYNASGGPYGRARAIPHIAPVEDWAAEELPQAIKRKIE